MKNVLFIIATIFILFATNCKKEEEQILSEFIIGDWEAPNREINFDENNKYILNIIGVQPSATCNATTYLVNDSENTITIDLPFCSQASVLIIPADTYDVLWSTEKKTMSWTVHGGGGEPTITWTKQ
ncbi:MAG: hypothetical protein JW830_02740 [Bacteroidales bacterium]|nr:hypothetical protein [Bacteroidales bacterium]